VRAGRRQLNMAQALAADFGQRNFHTAFVADHSAVFHPLILAAETFPIGYWAKDSGAEQSIALRFERAIVDGLRFGYFAVRPAPDFFRGSQTDADSIEIGDRICHVKGARTIQGVSLLPAVVRHRGRLLKSSSSWSVTSGHLFFVAAGLRSMRCEPFLQNLYRRFPVWGFPPPIFPATSPCF